MHFQASWHAQGLRWIASLLQDLAVFLEPPAVEPASASGADCVEETRLRVHIRGL